MGTGKHTQEQLEIKRLNKIIDRKDREIKDIKFSLADILSYIRNLNESNDYNDPSVRKRKISEICTDTRYQLLIDELESNTEKAKIIELHRTDQSNR